MRELDVVGVRVEMPSNQPIVLLREVGGDRFLPIWIGAVEATAIAFAQQGVVPPRPMTHDLFRDVLDAVGVTLEQVRITEVRDNTYYAELVFSGGLEVSSRPSDSIALALRTGSPIYASEPLLDEVGVLMSDPDSEEQEDEVARFRQFLDEVTPEDFSG
ncbi:bifunctional nuclease family protein [Jiangella ureilytica]|uniref:Bifunctional nuclease family protein n=1 Tax=Jiangella ureilytica TaxID=2530374 RepID=A0A4R4RJC7_9ACTN|nr:bifunctional nuclease family protein [Jiangella ureilytica]TDC49617.1 bifunctional nuclease family protein [Jiangella ureilytica]